MNGELPTSDDIITNNKSYIILNKTTPYNAFLDVVWGVNNGIKQFKFNFNADTQAYDFIDALNRLDRFLFDIDHNINYVTVEFSGRTYNNN